MLPNAPAARTAQGEEEQYVDERGEVWTRPTAYAYAQVCKALNRCAEASDRIDLAAVLLALGVGTDPRFDPGPRANIGAIATGPMSDFRAPAPRRLTFEEADVIVNRWRASSVSSASARGGAAP